MIEPSLALKSASSHPHVARLAWWAIAANVAVILWGGFVRASGSGAGCGSHWPLCNGEVIPHAKTTALVIELTHRVTSGIAMIVVFALAVVAWRAYPKGHRVRRAAVTSAVLISFEAIIGAGLVLFELVAHDASSKRALSMVMHFTNTLLLLAALVMTAWWASGKAAVRVRKQGAVAWTLGAAAFAMVLVGMSGAVAALGDTLFPSRSLAEGLANDFSPGAHLFLRLRVLHPFFAAGGALLIVLAATVARVLRPTRDVRVLSHVVTGVVALQVAIGLWNLMLLAPIPMQLVHLLLADAVWIALMLLSAAALADVAPASESVVDPGEDLLRDVAVR